jgi:hypothetical protein
MGLELHYSPVGILSFDGCIDLTACSSQTGMDNIQIPYQQGFILGGSSSVSECISDRMQKSALNSMHRQHALRERLSGRLRSHGSLDWGPWMVME